MKLHLLFFLLLLSISGFAERIRVQGNVRDQNGQPLAGVYIYAGQNPSPVAATDDDGVFSFYIEQNTVVRFESIGCTPQEIKIKGMQVLEIVLKTEIVQLEQVNIVAKVRKVVPEPTDIEIKGNFFHLRTRVKVPKELFKSDMRLVIQTSIYNITEDKRLLLKPLVLDGHEYSITQKRMYDFDMSRDPLANYIFTPTPDQLQSDIIPYYDSTYVADPRGDYRADVLLTLENYNRVIYRDSFAIARGLVNPLRFFQYDLGMTDLTDEQYIPQAALQLCNDRGEIALTYAPGEATLNLKDERNLSEITKLQERLKEIDSDPDAQLKRIVINGIASPEGRYAANKLLANKRMRNAGNLIMQDLKKSTRESVEMITEARVENWERVVDLMRKDSLEFADEIATIIKKYPNSQDHQFNIIRRLPYYRSVIVKNYLPSLRRVEYTFDYSLFRVLNDEEIRSLYQKDPKRLSRYEYYRLLNSEQDTAMLQKLFVQSLELYPRFILAANRWAIFNLQHNKPDDKILAPFISEDAPVEVLMNQTYTFLKQKRYRQADSISFYYMPDNAKTVEMKAVVATLNGDYETYYDYICAKGGLNEILLLMARKENEKAWEKSKALSTDLAVNNYVRAVIANRLDKIPEAMAYMRIALMQDPSLRQIAEVDGDVVDLIKIL